MKFKSEFDAFYLYFIVLFSIVLTATGIAFLFNDLVVIGVACLIFVGLFLYFIFTINYKLFDTALVFRIGFFKYGIKYENICEISNARNIFISLATSKERIKLVIKRKGKQRNVYISPKKHQEFLKELNNKCKEYLNG